MSVHNRAALVEYLCRVQHSAYEAAALVHGWQTHRDSRGDWDQVPEANRRTMRDSIDAVLDELDSMGMVRLPLQVKAGR